MSFLNTLKRLNHSPITDYHLAIMKNGKSHEDTQKFFADEAVQNLWVHITMVNIEMYNLEKQYVISSKIPSSNTTADQAKLYQEWQNSTQRYQNLKNNSSLFRVDTIQQPSSKKNSTISQTSNRAKTLNTKQEETKTLSNKDFILSIAGMFTSGYSDTSENVKSIISESIQEKHGNNHR